MNTKFPEREIGRHHRAPKLATSFDRNELRECGRATMGGAMSKRVERAEKTGVIALRDEGLTELPAKLFQIKSLRVCDLTNNKLKKLPAPLGGLSMLT